MVYLTILTNHSVGKYWKHIEHTCIYFFIVTKLIEYLAIISHSGFEVISLFPSTKLINPVHANALISVKHKSEIIIILLLFIYYGQ